MNSINYLFNLGGNFSMVIDQMSHATGQFNDQIKQSHRFVNALSGSMAKAAAISNGIISMSSAFDAVARSGIALDASLTDLSALTGLVGDDLKVIEGYARESAKSFGIDAAQAVESYKMVLGQLSPELAKSPVALKAMGDHIATLAKLMGGDARAAAEALNTAMNQYNVDLSDPIHASEEMARMMNVMAAASQAGSAEVPQIKAALEQAGMAAKSAGVSFEETNAAIQVLDKAGKKGSEGGVALRNVMATLAQGRFLPKQAQQELSRAGIDVSVLTDKTRSLSDRLQALAPLQKDSALLSKLFGKENANAALALISNITLMDEYTEAITGTSSAQDQATIIMGSYEERQAKVRAWLEDFKLNLFEWTDGFSYLISTVAMSIAPLLQLLPAVSAIIDMIRNLRPVLIGFVRSAMAGFLTLRTSAVTTFVAMRTQAVLSLITMQVAFNSGRVASFGFLGSIVQATWAVARFATVGLWNGLKALGAYILSLITGGTASATFSATASASFAVFKTSAVVACRAVSAAIASIPIIGWVAIAIVAIGALGVYLWNSSVKFRAVLKGTWAYISTGFSDLWEMVKTVFSAIGDLIVAAFNFDGEGIDAALSKMTFRFGELGQSAAKAYREAYDAEMARGEEKETEGGAGATPGEGESSGNGSSVGINVPDVAGDTGLSLGSVGNAGSGGGAGVKNISIKIDRLIDKFEIHTTNLNESASRIKEVVMQALTSAVNDINLVR